MPDPEPARTPIPVAKTPSLDQIFEALSNRRRRYALYYLRDGSENVATLEELVEYVLARDGDAEGGAERRRSVLTAFQHVHVPKLVELGVLEYDDRTSTVRYSGQPSVDEWVEHARYKEL